MPVEVKLTSKKGYKITPEKACKILKRKMEKEGIFDEMKERRSFTPESEKRKEAKRRRKSTIRMIQRMKG
jgi:ribosomal protein S21